MQENTVEIMAERIKGQNMARKYKILILIRGMGRYGPLVGKQIHFLKMRSFLLPILYSQAAVRELFPTLVRDGIVQKSSG